MKFNVGDKVKFLNETGGGVVSKIISRTMVNVMIEDGFEYPVITSELLKVEDAKGPAGKFFKQDFDVKLPKSYVLDATKNEKNKEQILEDKNHSKLVNLNFRKSPNEGLYLAYAPQDQQVLINGPFDLYLINFTEYEILFSFILKTKKGEFVCAEYDSIASKSKLLLENINTLEIEQWLDGFLQYIFIKETDTKVLLPGHSFFNIKKKRFILQESYKAYSFLDEKAIFFKLSDLNDWMQAETGFAAQKTSGQNYFSVKAKQEETQNLIEKHKIAEQTAEIDLHISSLRDDFSRLKGDQIYRIQIRYFQNCIESALEHNYKKLIIIHGIGNGTLKNAIISLTRDQADVEIKKASVLKYGTGALEINLL